MAESIITLTDGKYTIAAAVPGTTKAIAFQVAFGAADEAILNSFRAATIMMRLATGDEAV